MLTYPVVDRDRERLVADLVYAHQFQPAPPAYRTAPKRSWFRRLASTTPRVAAVR